MVTGLQPYKCSCVHKVCFSHLVFNLVDGLQVWGLFAPKFVFDAIGLLVTDVILLIAFLYYMFPILR